MFNTSIYKSIPVVSLNKFGGTVLLDQAIWGQGSSKGKNFHRCFWVPTSIYFEIRDGFLADQVTIKI